MIINLNHSYIYLSTFECGETLNIELKVGRKTLLLDVKKDSQGAFISVFPKVSNDRKSFSKYGVEIHSVLVKSDAMIGREFIENIAIIEEAQNTVRRYSDILRG